MLVLPYLVIAVHVFVAEFNRLHPGKDPDFWQGRKRQKPQPVRQIEDEDYKVIAVRSKRRNQITLKAVPILPTLREVRAKQEGRNLILLQATEAAVGALRAKAFTQTKYPPKANILVRVHGIVPDVVPCLIEQLKEHGLVCCFICFLATLTG